MADRGNILHSGDALYSGPVMDQKNRVESTNRSYQLIMQPDGNLVLYKLEKGRPHAPLWASNTNRQEQSQSYQCIMQTDGNLVIYAPDGTTPIWASHTNHHPDSYLVVQDNRDVVIYASDGITSLWHTGTQVG